MDLFAVVFAAFSGLSCGANLTGDVKHAGRNIPRGMFFASLTGALLRRAYLNVSGILLFVLMALAISSSVWRLYLLDNGL